MSWSEHSFVFFRWTKVHYSSFIEAKANLKIGLRNLKHI